MRNTLARTCLALTLTTWASAAQLPAPLDAQMRQATETLRQLAQVGNAGPWRFHWPALPGAEQPEFDDSSWPQVWPEHRWYHEHSAVWYRLTWTVPARIGLAPCPGGPVRLRVAVDDYGEIYVNGRLVQKFHWDGGDVTLTDDARAGQRFVIALKVINRGGPGRLMWARLSFARLEPVRRALAEHYERLRFLQDLLRTEKHLAPRHVAAVRAGLKALDWSLVGRDVEGFAKSVEASTKALMPLSGVAKKYAVYLVGHAHIDMNWLWLWPETIKVCHDTWSQVIRFMEQFPQFCFSESQPAAYRAVEEHYPELFDKIRHYIRAGRWDYVGATWVQGDTNMASGEALCRQLLVSREYAMEKFGRWTQTAWLPDNFGHAWTVPTIFADAGLKWYYFTRCNPGYPLFWWEGPDGSRLAAFSYGGYSWRIKPNVVRAALDVNRRVGVPKAMIVYGVGDHGGGPTRQDIEEALALQKDPLLPRVVFARTDQFFHDALAGHPKLPVWRHEMNFTFRGCYTTHSDMKRRNRQLENLLPCAEAAASAAWLLAGRRYNSAAFLEAWRNVCFNQFHDLLPGSAIHDSYKYSHQLYDAAEQTARRELAGSLEALAQRIDTQGEGVAVLLYSRLGWPRSGQVTVTVQGLAAGPLVAVGPDGREGPVQVVRHKGGAATVSFRADVPSCGWAVYHLRSGRAQPADEVRVAENRDTVALENGSLRVVVEKSSGAIRSLIDKRLGRELVARGERLGALQVLWEEPHDMSAWKIGNIRWTRELTAADDVKVEQAGPLVASVRTVHRWRNSTFVGHIILRAASRQLDFDLLADWQEVGNRHDGSPMLKVAFPLRMNRPAFTCEIPFGSIERSPDGRDVPAQKWADMTDYRVKIVGGRPVPVDLSRYFNQDAFATADAPGDGDFDYGGIAYPAEMLGGAQDGMLRWRGLPWRVPPTAPGAMNAVKCDGQRIALPPNNAGGVVIFGASAPGTSSGRLELVFDDGTRAAETLKFSDWCYGPGSREEIALRWPYRYAADGRTGPEVRIFARSFSVPAGKRLKALTLPHEPRMRVFAITLGRRTERVARWGVTLLNDCKYGHDARGATLRLTLLRASYNPDPGPDVGRHRIRYTLLPHEGRWTAASVVRAAYELNNPIVARVIDKHAGPLPPRGSLVQLSPDNVVLTAVKKAEHGPGLIVRWYEAEGRETEAVLRAGFDVAAAELTNVVESQRRRILAVAGRAVRVKTRAHGVVTVRLVPRAHLRAGLAAK